MRLAAKPFLISLLVIFVLATVGVLSFYAVGNLVSVNREIATRTVPAMRLAASTRESIAPLVRRSEEHTSELQSPYDLVCRLLLDTSTSLLYPLSLHDALPIYAAGRETLPDLAPRHLCSRDRRRSELLRRRQSGFGQPGDRDPNRPGDAPGRLHPRIHRAARA